jgi:low affinity Fe/Cu permease
VINTATTIVTFLMVFLIQNTQNRDSEAIHIKLDELVRALEGAHNAVLNLEDLADDELERVRKDYCRLAEAARAALLRGEHDTDTPDVERRSDEPANQRRGSRPTTPPGQRAPGG